MCHVSCVSDCSQDGLGKHACPEVEQAVSVSFVEGHLGRCYQMHTGTYAHLSFAACLLAAVQLTPNPNSTLSCTKIEIETPLDLRSHTQKASTGTTAVCALSYVNY